MSWLRLTFGLAGRAIVRPTLAVDLLTTLWAFRARNWYRHLPFLPLPPREYMQWRMYTAYGQEDVVPPIEDVIRFVRWRRSILHR